MSRWFIVALGLLIGAGVQAPAAASAPAAHTVLLLGDSLSAAYGISRESAWPALLAERLAEQSPPWRLVNASISGDTSAGGLSRLPDLVNKHRPRLLILELGANDGLRGQSLGQLERNLQEMMDLVQAQGGRTLLMEMRIPSNYGPRYTTAFTNVFSTLADDRPDVTLVPFFLADIALDPGYFLQDGIHPNARAQPLLFEAVWPYVAAATGQLATD